MLIIWITLAQTRPALAALALQEAITPFKNAQQYGYKSDSSVTPEPEPEPETPFSDVTEE